MNERERGGEMNKKKKRRKKSSHRGEVTRQKQDSKLIKDPGLEVPVF